jgi:hypothetical protein
MVRGRLCCWLQVPCRDIFYDAYNSHVFGGQQAGGE